MELYLKINVQNIKKAVLINTLTQRKHQNIHILARPNKKYPAGVRITGVTQNQLKSHISRAILSCMELNLATMENVHYL